MPLLYAVAEKHPTISHGPGSYEYFEVPIEVAETHGGGCYALHNEDRERVSQWSPLNVDLEKIKPSTRSGVKDSINQVLSEGDFVGYGDSVTSPMTIAKVLGFTNKQVRLLPMGSSRASSARLMYEHSLIRLPEMLWTGSL